MYPFGVQPGMSMMHSLRPSNVIAWPVEPATYSPPMEEGMADAIQYLGFRSTDLLPTDPPRPAPMVMTAEEAAVYLRLDRKCDGTLRAPADVAKSLEHLVARHGLRPLKVGRFARYAKSELDRWIQERVESNNADPPHSEGSIE